LQPEGDLLPAAFPDREGVIGLSIPIDDQVRDLLELRVPDPAAHRLVSVVDFRPVFAELLPQARRRGAVVRTDRNDADLDGRDPERKGASVVLDQDPDEALERPEERTV